MSEGSDNPSKRKQPQTCLGVRVRMSGEISSPANPTKTTKIRPSFGYLQTSTVHDARLAERSSRSHCHATRPERRQNSKGNFPLRLRKYTDWKSTQLAVHGCFHIEPEEFATEDRSFEYPQRFLLERAHFLCSGDVKKPGERLVASDFYVPVELC